MKIYSWSFSPGCSGYPGEALGVGMSRSNSEKRDHRSWEADDGLYKK
ncbi:MAG: hypothetical protein ABIT07_07815 [Ferruginibacter sp.]